MSSALDVTDAKKKSIQDARIISEIYIVDWPQFKINPGAQGQCSLLSISKSCCIITH
jgi:hypothetical protein